MAKIKYKLTLFFLLAGLAASAQDSSLLHMLNDSMAAHPKKMYVMGTFKAEHIINLQTVESPATGNLNFVNAEQRIVQFLRTGQCNAPAGSRLRDYRRFVGGGRPKLVS